MAEQTYIRSYTEWMEAAKDPRIAVLFDRRQRERWLARKVLARWRQRIWIRRTQCNVSLIEMTPVEDRDAVLLTDTTHRQIYRFHRSDIYNTLLFNLGLCSYMLPTPRAPSNPWTNKPLTYAQTIAVCERLLRDFAARGICPPPLFALFWEARFDLARFERLAAPTLGYYAVTSYFKEYCPDNLNTIANTIFTLITRTGSYIPEERVQSWVRQEERTSNHSDWLTLVRDYTLYLNLHIQVRPAWISAEAILHDVRELLKCTPELQGLSSLSFDTNDIMSYYIQYLMTAGATNQSSLLLFSYDEPPALIAPDEMTGIPESEAANE